MRASPDFPISRAIPPDAVPVPGPDLVVEAIYHLQNAETLYQSRLCERLHLRANEVATLQFLLRMDALGLEVRALDVSRNLGVTSGATSAILSHLVERGYLTRTINPRDGRGQFLHPTPAATSAFALAIGDSQIELRRLFSQLSSRESKRVIVLLSAVTTSLGESALPVLDRNA